MDGTTIPDAYRSGAATALIVSCVLILVPTDAVSQDPPAPCAGSGCPIRLVGGSLFLLQKPRVMLGSQDFGTLKPTNELRDLFETDSLSLVDYDRFVTFDDLAEWTSWIVVLGAAVTAYAALTDRPWAWTAAGVSGAFLGSVHAERALGWRAFRRAVARRNLQGGS